MRRQVRPAVGSVCEELLMNALYDAPVDALGRPMFADIDPHDRKDSRSPRPVSIRYAATEHAFAVAVRDRFGRLAKNTIRSEEHTSELQSRVDNSYAVLCLKKRNSIHLLPHDPLELPHHHSRFTLQLL